MLHNEEEGIRQKGRPMKTWLDNGKNMKSFGQLWEAAQIQNYWKKIKEATSYPRPTWKMATKSACNLCDNNNHIITLQQQLLHNAENCHKYVC